MLNHMLRAASGNQSNLNLVFKSSATSTSSTIVAPSTIVAGDLLLSYDNAQSNGFIPTSVIPSGFGSPAIINQSGLGNRRVIVSAKIADGTEAGVTYTGMDGNNTDAKIMLVFSTNGATSYSTFDVGFLITDTDPGSQTIMATLGNSPLLALGYIRNTSVTPGNIFTPTETGVVTVPSHYAYYKIYNASPADITVDTTDNGGNANMVATFYIEVN